MSLKCLKPGLATLDGRRVKPPPKEKNAIYYTPEFRAWREQVIERAGGRCQDPSCKSPHRRGMRLFADHVVELKDGGAPFDLENGLARCGSCHSRKTAEARAKRRMS